MKIIQYLRLQILKGFIQRESPLFPLEASLRFTLDRTIPNIMPNAIEPTMIVHIFQSSNGSTRV